LFDEISPFYSCFKVFISEIILFISRNYYEFVLHILTVTFK